MATVAAMRCALIFVVLGLAPLFDAAARPPTIVVLDFEIEDDTVAQGGVSDVGAQQRRLRMVTAATRKELASDGAFEVIDDRPATDLIAHARALQALHACNGCEVDIARALGADLVLVGWVQKVSNLILNVNAGVRDVQTERVLLIRSVDMRGNTDASWERAARRLAQDIRERLPGRFAP
jgi:hypothetical protein